MRALLCGLLLAGMAFGAAPPAGFTLQQVALLRTRSSHVSAAHQAWKEGKQEQAITHVNKAFQAQVRLNGPWHRDTALIASWLADWHRARREWRQEARAWGVMLEAYRHLHGEHHWKAVVARWGERTAKLRSRWTEQENRLWDRADSLQGRVFALWQQGKSVQALPLAAQSLRARLSLAGRDHPAVALALMNLAAQYQGVGAYKAALPLYRKAVAVSREVHGEQHPHHAMVLGGLASLYQQMGDHKAALPLKLKALQVTREALGEKHPEPARALNSLASLYREMGNHKQALPLSKQALQICQKALGVRHPEYANSLNNLALLYKSMGDYKQALPLFHQALQIRKEVLGEKHPDYANSLNNLATLYHSMGDNKAALSRYQEALQIYKKVLGEKHPLYALSLGNLAALYKSMGDHKAALPLSKQALEIKKEALGEKHPLYAISLNNLAMLYEKMGDHKAALPLHKQVLAIIKEALGEKHPDYATSLINLAALYRTMGDYKAALPLVKQGMEIIKEALGEKHPHYATGLHNLAVLYKSMGDHKAALPLFQTALKVRKEALGEKHPLYALSLGNLAALYKSMGDHKAALPLFRQALAIYKEALGEKHPEYATGLNGLAFLYQDMGDHKQALALHKQALASIKEALGEKHPEYARSLNSLATLYKSMGDHKAALPLCKQALAIFKEVLGEKHPEYATCLNNLAFLYQLMGDHNAALPLFKQALAIRKEVLVEKHPDYAQSLNNLATLYQDMGDHKQALPLAEEAAGLTISYLRASAAVLSDRQQLATAATFRNRLDNRLSVLDADGYRHALAWKGAVLLRQRQRRLFSALSSGPKTRKAAEELRATVRQIATLCSSARPAREQLERLTREQERLQAELSLLSAEASAAFKEKPLTPQALSKALPEGVVLVDYLFYRRFGITYRDGRPNWQRHLVAFVSRKGKPTARIDLGPADRAVLAAHNWRRLIMEGKAASAAGAEVKRLIWSPLEKHLEGAKVVLISPDEVLASVPFAALPGKKPGTYLIEDVALAVVPVPQMLPELVKPVDKAKRLKPSLLVVGNVDYARARAAVAKADVEDLRGAPLGIRRDWSGLPATFGEAAAVSKSFTKLFKKAGTITDLDGADATKAKVRQALAKVRYAHLATHGFFAHQNLKSALSSKKASAFFGSGGMTGWHPLLLSGIVLAGANREPKEGEEDGILTALEVSEMQLPKLELVVLSACETGLGKSAGGEGLLGLQRAFQVAGARTVIASLWAVDDKATQFLMGEFYRVAWDTENIVSRAEALRQAQLALLKEGHRRGLGKKGEKLPKGETRLPPLYWAAFVLSGDWR
jgi:tetratricopeptide (TPR) repeat protein/CHAT domain-containing protein